MKLLMSTKPQFKMYLDEELIERLNKAAKRFSRESKQAVVEEIVRIYLPTWIAVNDSMRRAVEFQIQQSPPESERQVNGAVVRKPFLQALYLLNHSSIYGVFRAFYLSQLSHLESS